MARKITFSEGWSWFKFNKLGLTIGMAPMLQKGQDPRILNRFTKWFKKFRYFLNLSHVSIFWFEIRDDATSFFLFFGFVIAISWTIAMQSFKDILLIRILLSLWKAWVFHTMTNKVNEPKNSTTIFLILSIKTN